MLKNREKEKQLSRELDELRLTTNLVTNKQLKKENGFFSSLPLHKFKIVKIGNKTIENKR